jgi:hypothetical protein
MKRTLCITIFALALIPFLSVSAEVTFYADLESEESVEAGGGEVIGNGGQFVPGYIGNGYMSTEAEDVVRYPFEGAIEGYQEQGTLELWLTLGWDIDNFTDAIGVDWRDWGLGEVFMFWSYNDAGTDAIGMMIGDGSPNSPIAQFRVREAVEEWHSAASEELDWKEGSTHHMAGTWGPNGVNLYLDGEWAGDEPYQGGPANPIERLSINNNEADPASFPSFSVVDELKIHDVQLSDDEVRGIAAAVDPAGKIAMTWAAVKKGR